MRDLYLRWESVLGLLRRQTRIKAGAPVKVYPNLVDVRKYDLMLRRNRLWELGLRNVRTLGGGAEFERLRDYTPDDEYRRITWKATARRGKPISMEFESERSQNIYCLLDIGRMMRSPVGEVAKMDYAINAVLLLAYVAAQKGDRIGLLTFADRVETYVAPQGGKVQFQRMLEQLYAVEGQPIEPDYNAAFSYFAAHQHKRGLVLLFTDLTGSITTEALIAQMTRLRRRHLPLLVTLGDPTVQKLARQPITGSASLYQRTVAEQLLDERQLTLDRLRQRGVQTLDVPADELSVAVINRYLAVKQQHVGAIPTAHRSASAIDQVDVLLHGIFRGRALQLLPGVPLGAPDKVKLAWPARVDVAHRGLLVQRIQLQQRVVVRPLRKRLRVARGLFKLLPVNLPFDSCPSTVSSGCRCRPRRQSPGAASSPAWRRRPGSPGSRLCLA